MIKELIEMEKKIEIIRGNEQRINELTQFYNFLDFTKDYKKNCLLVADINKDFKKLELYKNYNLTKEILKTIKNHIEILEKENQTLQNTFLVFNN